MKFFIEKENKNIEIHFEGILKDFLDKIEINKENVIVMRNNELLIEEDQVHDSDELKIISVISGG